MATLRQNDHSGFTNKGAPLTNDEIDANWTFLYDLIYSNSEALSNLHSQNTDTFLDQGGADEVSAADLAALVYEADNNPLHVQGTDQTLDLGGANEVSVAQVKTVVDTAEYGVLELDSSGNTDGSGTILPHSNSNAITITFRTADIVDNKKFYVMDVDRNASANNITIATEGTETIDGGNEISIAVNGGFAEIVALAGNLFTLNRLLT